MNKNRDSFEQKVESMDIEQLRHGNTFSLCTDRSDLLFTKPDTLIYWLLSHAANTPFLLSSPADVIKNLQDKTILLLGFFFVLLFVCFCWGFFGFLLLLLLFFKAPCPLSHTAFYCLGERNLMTFQQYSNYCPGGICRGRRSLTNLIPKSISPFTGKIRTAVALGYSFCTALHEWKYMFLFLISVSLSEISLP